MAQVPLMNPATKLLVDSYIKNPVNSIGFNGPNNSGKLQIAKYLCRKALGMNPNEFDMKVDIIDCTDGSGIDEVRELKKKLAIKSVGVETLNRAVIFEDFHKMSLPAQNSTLKLLEEPPLDTMIIILVNAKSNILPTITSRLQWVDILPLDLKTLEKEYGQYDKVKIKQAYLLSDGYLTGFEKILMDENNVMKLAVDDVKKILKLKKYERISSLDNILNNQSYSQEDFLTALQKIYTTLVRREVRNNTNHQHKVLLGLDQINKTKESLKYNPNPKLIFTDLFYKI